MSTLSAAFSSPSSRALSVHGCHVNGVTSESVAQYPHVTSEAVSTNEDVHGGQVVQIKKVYSLLRLPALHQQFPNAYAVAKAEICPSGFSFLAVFGFSNCSPTIVEVKSIRFWAAISNDQVYSHLTMWNRMNVTRSHDSRFSSERYTYALRPRAGCFSYHCRMCPNFRCRKPEC